MAVVSVATGSQTATLSTEHSLASATGVGIYIFEVDSSAMQSGDTLQIRIKTKCRSVDDLKVAYLETLTNAQTNLNWHSVPVPITSGTGIEVAITQTAGTGRVYPWNLMRM